MNGARAALRQQNLSLTFLLFTVSFAPAHPTRRRRQVIGPDDEAFIRDMIWWVRAPPKHADLVRRAPLRALLVTLRCAGLMCTSCVPRVVARASSRGCGGGRCAHDVRSVSKVTGASTDAVRYSTKVREELAAVAVVLVDAVVRMPGTIDCESRRSERGRALRLRQAQPGPRARMSSPMSSSSQRTERRAAPRRASSTLRPRTTPNALEDSHPVRAMPFVRDPHHPHPSAYGSSRRKARVRGSG